MKLKLNIGLYSFDLELLNLASRMVTVAINNSRRFDEILVTNEARRKT